MSNMYLGNEISTGNAVTLDPQVLTKHMVILGASGSGKTFTSKVVVEEAVRRKIPVIAVDSQGDIASLGVAGDPSEMVKRGLAACVSEEYWDLVDLKIWTPGSTSGLQLSLQPCLDMGAFTRREDKIRAVHGMAQELGAFAGYGDESTVAGLSMILSYANEHDLAIEGLDDVCDFLRDPPDMLAGILEDIFPAKDRKKVLKSLTVKMIGPRQLLMDGMPINVDTLFGYDPGGAYDNGKVRVSVICLNALHNMDDKQIFIAALARAVNDWMVQFPQSEPVGMLYLDEIAPFIPPVRKPICKDPLLSLLRQARKYGVCMLLATQSPGDIDFTGLAQVCTKVIGRIATRQEAYKIAPLLAGTAAGDAIMDQLPSLSAGEFIMVCPDAFDNPILFKSRWLVTSHVTLTLDQMSELVTAADRVTYG